MRKLLEQRARILKLVRQYFVGQHFLEVETPQLVPVPSTEPYLEVFQTQLTTASGLKDKAYLTTSPEYAMKKLIAEGSGNIFQICKSFRNGEEVSEQHNPEFTLLEWYRLKADYRQTMIDTENLVNFVREGLGLKQTIEYQGEMVDLGLPWPRASVAELFEQHVGIGKSDLLDISALARAAKQHQLTTSQSDYNQLFHLLFLNLIEPKLPINTPLFVYDYPLPQAALAKESVNSPGFAERFELYISGIELVNAFSELIDPDVLLARQKADLAERKKLGKTEYGLDMQLITAGRQGWPEMSGVALGLDRLIMLLTNSSNVEQVLSFPASRLFSCYNQPSYGNS